MAALVGFVAAHAGTIATVASIASAGIGAAGAISGARNEKALIEANAAQMEQTAKDRRVAASVEAEKLRRKQRVLLASDRGKMAQAGALSGTSLDLLDQNRVAAELDALTVQYNGDQGASDLERQAILDRSEAGGVGRSGYLTAAGRIGSGLASIDPLNYSRSRPSGAVAPVL